MAPRSSRSVLIQTLLVASSTLTGLLIAEVYLRLTNYPVPRIEVVRRDDTVSPLRELFQLHQPSLFRETSEGWRLEPNTTVTVEQNGVVELSTNSFGLRNRELGEKSGPRILFLGDSLTMARGIPEPDTFVRQIESIARGSGRNIETVNGGIEGASLRDEVAILSEIVDRVKPDYVVLCFCLNDTITIPAQETLVPPRLLNGSHVIRFLYYHLSIRAFPRKKLMRPGELPENYLELWRSDLVNSEPREAGDPWNSPGAFNAMKLEHLELFGAAWSKSAWTIIERNLEALASLSQTKGFNVALVVFPLRIQVEASYLDDFPQRMLAELAAKEGFPVFDLLPALREAYHAAPEVPLYFPNDWLHFTQAGHERIASELLPFISKLL